MQKAGVERRNLGRNIPPGAPMNMGGASITITILTLSAVHALGIPVDFITAFLLIIIAAIGTCGTSGIPGGALPLVPMACSLFNTDNDVAMQMVIIGLITSVVQDPCGTLLNSLWMSCLRRQPIRFTETGTKQNKANRLRADRSKCKNRKLQQHNGNMAKLLV